MGSKYAFGECRAQFVVPRNTANPYLYVRFLENGSFQPWYKLSCDYADSAGALSAGTKTISGSFNLSGTNPSVYFQGGTPALGYASTAGAYSGSSNAGDLVLRSDTNTALILQSGSGTYGSLINTNNIVNTGGNLRVD